MRGKSTTRSPIPASSKPGTAISTQTDFWLVLMGHIKVGIHRDDGRTWRTVIGEKRPGILIIPPPLWHGAATVGHEPAGLLYYVTQRLQRSAARRGAAGL